MNIFGIAFNNLKRRRIKMLLIIFGLVAGIATAVTLFTIVESMKLSLGDQIDEFGANIVIVPQSEGMEISYGGTNISRVSLDYHQLTEADLQKIPEIPDYNSINIISPKIVTTVKINNREALLVGIYAHREFIMKPWFSLDQQAGLEVGQKPGDLALTVLPDNGLILGSSAARALSADIGEEIQIGNNRFQVFGILNPLGTVEDGLIYANLSKVQDIMDRPGEISMIEISAYCNSCPIEEIAAQLSSVMPSGNVTALRQAAQLREETIQRFSLFSLLLSTVILVIAALMVFTSMMSSVHERTREIGIFRAIGFRGMHIIQIFFIEAGLIGLIGGLTGYLLGSVAAYLIGPYLSAQSYITIWNPDILVSAVLLSILIASTATLYPSLKAANLDPVESLRFI